MSKATILGRLFIACFVVLSMSSALADEGARGIGIPFVTGNRLVTAPNISYPNNTGPGPVLLELRGIGTIFVSSCPGFFTSSTQLTYRNTSGRTVDIPTAAVQFSALNMFAPGEEAGMHEISSVGSGNDAFFHVVQFASGAERTAVATVTVSGLFDPVRNECRFNGQATIVYRDQQR